MKNHVRKIKEETAAASVIVLVTILTFITVLIGVFLTVSVLRQGQLKSDIRIQEIYAKDVNNIDEVYEQLERIEEANSNIIKEEDLEKIKEKYLGNTLYEVAYTPETVSESVTVDSASNGGQADQTFTQSTIGSLDAKWYVLNVDEDNLTLVSDVTKQNVTFSGVGGYNNCLYFLNEIASKLYSNNSLGATATALKLTDIKTAAENLNGSSWSWDNDFIAKHTYASDALAGTVISPSSKQYPSIYGTSTGTVNTNNSLYDETPGSKITNNVFTTASTLNVKHTYFYGSSAANTLSWLSTFGTTGVGKNLFNSSGSNYWLASRCVNASSSYADFNLRSVGSGYLRYLDLCYSYGNAYSNTLPLRVVVKVPASHVNVASDGTITIN